MPIVKWNNNFSVGVALFDAEHMQLLGYVNDFYDAVQEGINEAAVQSVLNGLINFSRHHFAHEEEFFEVCGYANAEVHRAEHRRLTEELLKFRNDWPNATIEEMVFNLNGFLLDWFKEHTIGMDREFCAELRKLGIR